MSPILRFPPGRDASAVLGWAKMGSVSEFLVVYLDSIDEGLLDYLDKDDELRPEVVKRLRYYASALLEGTITPAAVAEDWADWFDLTGETDRTYLAAVEALRDAYPEMRLGE